MSYSTMQNVSFLQKNNPDFSHSITSDEIVMIGDFIWMYLLDPSDWIKYKYTSDEKTRMEDQKEWSETELNFQIASDLFVHIHKNGNVLHELMHSWKYYFMSFVLEEIIEIYKYIVIYRIRYILLEELDLFLKKKNRPTLEKDLSLPKIDCLSIPE